MSCMLDTHQQSEPGKPLDFATMHECVQHNDVIPDANKGNHRNEHFPRRMRDANCPSSPEGSVTLHSMTQQQGIKRYTGTQAGAQAGLHPAANPRPIGSCSALFAAQLLDNGEKILAWKQSQASRRAISLVGAKVNPPSTHTLPPSALCLPLSSFAATASVPPSPPSPAPPPA